MFLGFGVTPMIQTLFVFFFFGFLVSCYNSENPVFAFRLGLEVKPKHQQ